MVDIQCDVYILCIISIDRNMRQRPFHRISLGVDIHSNTGAVSHSF